MGRLIRMINSFVQKSAYKDYYSRTRKMYEKKMTKVKPANRLTAAQKEEIRDFYKRLTGKDISTIYHEYFYARTGIYSKEYMPVDLYEGDLIGRANNMSYFDAYSDKNMDEVFLPNIKHPETILKNINGYFYSGNKPISKEEAIMLCQNLSEIIIKPSMSSKGSGVHKLNIIEGVTELDDRKITVEELFAKYRKNFIIQKAIRQHKDMGELNPTSINTIRVLTYRSGMEILVIYAVVRIGRKGQVIDNQSAGGISAMISEDGTLCKYGHGGVGDDNILKTDTGIVLEGYRIPHFDDVLETVKRAHYNLPFFDIVGWDMSVDENGTPVLVEWNGNPGPSQTACGTGLGKYTERIIRELWPRKNTRDCSRSYC
ncbi:MAG: hypothetical protein MJZ94_01230 [Bacteroidales bacterium]|nr:hypothetical protein [Bacteroidales bacterium]